MVRRGLYIVIKISELPVIKKNESKAVKGFQEIQNIHKKKIKNKKVIE
jgi:hypothetical protein